MTPATCETCGKELTWKGRGRPNTKFCSRHCKDEARTEQQHLELIESREGRTCRQCDKPLPAEMWARSATCSKDCSVRWANEQRAARKRAAKLAAPRACLVCGIDITETTRAHAQYCSKAHQQLDAQRRRFADGRTRTYFLGRNYGLSRDDYEARLAAQDNRCAICRTDNPGGKGGWHVDHCHDSGHIRGLLCHNCNVGLGNFKDDPVRLRAALTYLED